MSHESSESQATFLVQWAHAESLSVSWPVQCRFIAEKMTDDECRKVACMLETLTDHLRAIPLERRSAAITNQITRAVADIINE